MKRRKKALGERRTLLKTRRKSGRTLAALCCLAAAMAAALAPVEARGAGAARTTEDAVRARSQAAELGKLAHDMSKSLPQAVKRLVTRADELRRTGDATLAIGSTRSAARAYETYSLAAKTYRIVLSNGRALKTLAHKRAALERARLLAEATMPTAKFTLADAAARRHDRLARGFVIAGRIDRAVAELERGRKNIKKLLGPPAKVTIEQAIEARNQMSAAKALLRPKERPDRLPDPFDPTAGLLGGPITANLRRRAECFERAAEQALANNEYAAAKSLYVAAGRACRQFRSLELKALSARKALSSARQARGNVLDTFKGEARPVEFFRGIAALAGASRAFASEDFNRATAEAGKAATWLAAAHRKAVNLNRYEAARRRWASTLAGADMASLNRYAAKAFASAKAMADEAAKLNLDNPVAVAAKYEAASARLDAAVVSARTRQVLALLTTASEHLRRRENDAARRVLAQILRLSPGNAQALEMFRRLAPWRTAPISSKIIRGHGSAVKCVAFSPDGRKLVSASLDKSFKVWDVAESKCLTTQSGHSAHVYAATFSHDGRWIASAGDDNAVRIWDVATGQRLKSLRGHSEGVWSLDFSRDGRRIVSGGKDDNIKLWDTATGQCLKTFYDHSADVMHVAFSPDGRRILSASKDKTVRLWDAAAGKCLKTIREHGNIVTTVAFSPDGRQFASGSWDGTIKLWDAATGRCLKTLTHGGVNTVAYSTDGRILASGATDRNVKLWDVTTGQCLKTLTGHTAAVHTVAFSADARFLASGSADRSIRVWTPLPPK